jgi:hypothetical protein
MLNLDVNLISRARSNFRALYVSCPHQITGSEGLERTVMGPGNDKACKDSDDARLVHAGGQR